MENKNKINKNDICIAQMLYGGGGNMLVGYKVHEDKPYTMQVGYTVDGNTFVNRFGEIIPVFKEKTSLQANMFSSEYDKLLKEITQLPKGIYAWLDGMPSLDLAYLPDEIDIKSINSTLEELELALYNNLEKLGTRDFTELTTIPLHSLEDPNDIGLNLETGKFLD